MLGSSWTISENASMRIPTQQERAEFLTRYHAKLLWHDQYASFLSEDMAVLTVTGDVDISEPLAVGAGIPMPAGLAEEQITAAVDIVKWALMLESKMPAALVEGTIVYADGIGGSLPGGAGAFKRQDVTSGVIYDISLINMPAVAARVARAQHASASVADIADGFWYWSRCCLAALPRDALLEAIVGMEHLLVPDPGESRYRFGLHGAAVLAASYDEAIQIAMELKRLYNKRSKIAHGNRDQQIHDAGHALRLFSRLMEAIIEFIESRLGDIVGPSRVAVEIENEVLKRSLIGGQPPIA